MDALRPSKIYELCTSHSHGSRRAVAPPPQAALHASQCPARAWPKLAHPPVGLHPDLDAVGHVGLEQRPGQVMAIDQIRRTQRLRPPQGRRAPFCQDSRCHWPGRKRPVEQIALATGRGTTHRQSHGELNNHGRGRKAPPSCLHVQSGAFDLRGQAAAVGFLGGSWKGVRGRHALITTGLHQSGCVHHFRRRKNTCDAELVAVNGLLKMGPGTSVQGPPTAGACWRVKPPRVQDSVTAPCPGAILNCGGRV